MRELRKARPTAELRLIAPSFWRGTHSGSVCAVVCAAASRCTNSLAALKRMSGVPSDLRGTSGGSASKSERERVEWGFEMEGLQASEAEADTDMSAASRDER